MIYPGLKSFMSAIALVIGLNSVSQSHNQSQKLAVLQAIFEEVVNVDSCGFIAMFADMGYRTVKISLGSMASSVEYSNIIYDDSATLRAFQKKSIGNGCSIVYVKSFTQQKHNRRNFILSREFSSYSPTINKRQIYLEIHRPLFGWETIDLFRYNKTYANSDVMRFEDCLLVIPVFKYDITSSTEIKQTWLFKFKLIDDSKDVILSYEGKQEL